MPQVPPQLQSPKPAAKPDPAALLARMAEGDVAALGDLFDQTSRPVYSLVMQLVRSHDDAEDIVESTFWEAWQGAAQLRDHPDPRSWLLTTGRQRALDQLRARRRPREELLLDKRQFRDLVSSPDGNPEPSAQALWSALNNLDPETRQVIELGYFRGLSQSDIADLVEVPAAKVKARLRSALQLLGQRDIVDGQPE